jgi:hypothetical protein
MGIVRDGVSATEPGTMADATKACDQAVMKTRGVG